MILLYKPSCSKSRGIRQILDERGYQARERDYVQSPLSLIELQALRSELDVDAIEMMRPGEAAFSELGLSRSDSDDVLLGAIAQRPILLQRPIVLWRGRGVIARPPERAFSLIPDRHFVIRRADFSALEELVDRMLLAPIDLDPNVAKSEWRTADLLLGCFDRSSGECVGSALFFQQSYRGDPAWRLRAMAVDDSLQGLGIGRRLLDEGVKAVRAEDPDATRFWCNARDGATEFYRSAGWTIDSERFQMEGVGPHYKMTFDTAH